MLHSLVDINVLEEPVASISGEQYQAAWHHIPEDSYLDTLT
jgi:hypothetical protein